MTWAAARRRGAQQLPLARDPVCGRPIERQRVSAPRLGKAPLQFRSRAVEEEDADVHSLIDPQAIYPGDDRLGVKGAGAAVDADGQRPGIGVAGPAARRGEQPVQQR